MGKHDQIPAGTLELSNEAFLMKAYATLLHGEPAPAVLMRHLVQLRTGTAREAVWKDIAVLKQQLDVAVHVGPETGPLTAAGAPERTLSLDAMLGMHGEAFVRAAYTQILGREPEPSGLSNYLSLLRAGVSNLAILKALSESGEARARNVEFPGLREAIASYRKAQRKTLFGWYHRQVMGVASDLPRDRELRSMLYRAMESGAR
jgi:hypothetical protein